MRNWLVFVGLVLLMMQSIAAVPSTARAQGNAVPSLVVSSGHSNGVGSIAFAPDGRWVASGSSDSTIKIWDSLTGRLLRTLAGHTSMVSAVAVSPDGRRIASVSDSTDKRAIIWDAATGEALQTIPNIAPGQYDNVLPGITFSRDGRSVFTVSFEAIRRWDIASGKLAQSVVRQPRRGLFNMWQRFAVSSDERHIVAADSSQILLLDAANGKQVRSLGSHPLKTYNGVTYPEPPGSIVFSPDGELVAVGYPGKAAVYLAKAGKLLRDFAVLPHAIAFSPDNRLVAFATHAGYPPSHIAGLQLWDVQSGGHVRTLAEDKATFAVAFSADGTSIAAGFGDKLEA